METKHTPLHTHHADGGYHPNCKRCQLNASAPDLLWYLQELTEAVQTLAKRHGYQTPQCLPQALAAIARATGKLSRGFTLEYEPLAGKE